MSGYGFGKKPGAVPAEETRIDLTGITRSALPLDPAREAAAIERGTALGFVDREAGEGPSVRRRRQAAPQTSVYIKGPKDTLDWFIEYTNAQGHRSYWQALETFRTIVEARDRD